MNNIKFLSVREGTPASGYWDQTFLLDLLKDIPDSDRQVVVIPGAYQGDLIPEINKELAQYKKVLVFITSDEEGKFNCSQLDHPDMKVYCQYGTCGNGNIFPIGYTSETRKWLKKIGLVKKNLNLFFAGQLNSPGRKKMFDSILDFPNSILYGTDGFAKGYGPEEYYTYMAQAKSTPSPGGHVSPDSFRFYEGLEAGCIPSYYPSYMLDLFPDFPSPISNDQTFSWWIRKKVELRNQLKKDLGINDVLTVVISTSPIKSHPSTKIIDETIKSIRHHTMSDIIITIDGVRKEQEHLRSSYEEYVRRLLWKCNFEYENVIPIVFEEHVHQSGMMKEALNHVDTPLVMYVEHDTPLVTDEKIDWKLIIDKLLNKEMNMVRFHHEAKIPEEHNYLMLHSIGNEFRATKQWSQRPHIARTDFYNEVMSLFSPNANCFIEDFVYSRCVNGDWNDWKVAIYTPELFNIKRSLNLDGRAGDVKYDDKQIW